MIYLQAGGDYLRWRSLPLFFLSIFCAKRQQDEGLTGNSDVRTEGTDPGVGIDDVDVREEVEETVRCFFTDLW